MASILNLQNLQTGGIEPQGSWSLTSRHCQGHSWSLTSNYCKR